MKTFEFTEQEAELLRKEQYKYLINDNIDHFLLLVQQIISERITPEPGESIKPIPSIPIVGGWSVASDRTEPGESGQSAEEYQSVFNKACAFYTEWAQGDSTTELMAAFATAYASQVCADKEREISLLKKELDRAKEEIERSHMDKIYSIHDLKSELSAANESLTVMVRRNTELEEQNKKYWFMIEHGLGVEDMAPPTYPHP